MALPSTITDLSTNTASNSPLGSDAVGTPGTVDDFFRHIQAILRDESLLKSWERRGITPTYVSGTTFSTAGDNTSFFSTNRRLKAVGTATIYAAIVSSSYNGAVTTTTLLPDSGTLDTSLSSVQLGIDPLSAAVIMTGSYYPLTGGDLNGNMSLSNRDVAGIKVLAMYQEYDNGNSGAGPKTIDWSNGSDQKITLNANTTLAVLTASAVGHYQLRLIQDGTGGRTVAFTGLSASSWLNNSAQPTFNTAASGQTLITLFWNGTGYVQGAQKVGTA